MISAEDFVRGLKARRFTFFTGVPCSFFQSAIDCVTADQDLRYVIVPNEGAALAAAAGAYLGGLRPAVLIQNSGFGNLINPLTSLHMIYRLPMLLFVSGRAYGIPDEPQHEIIGRTMGPILDQLGIAHQDLPEDFPHFEQVLDEALAAMKKDEMPYAFFVKKGTVGSKAERAARPADFPLKRIDAIRIVMESLEGTEYVISTTGKPSRELFSVCDRSRNFYMQGSMGHAAGIGLGLALVQPAKKIVVLDGDGALLMHMGILSSIGHYRPRNLFHIVLDNESYETTGDQDTTSATTDFVKIASASGYRLSAEAKTEVNLRSGLQRMLSSEGPAFLRVKINRFPTPNVPRITTKYSSKAIAEIFRSELTRSS